MNLVLLDRRADQNILQVFQFLIGTAAHEIVKIFPKAPPIKLFYAFQVRSSCEKLTPTQK
jgi:hypothetical protein